MRLISVVLMASGMSWIWMLRLGGRRPSGVTSQMMKSSSVSVGNRDAIKESANRDRPSTVWSC
jgi:hypothetical protein